MLRHTHVSANYATSVAVRSDGTVAAWGVNGFGQTTVPDGLSNVIQAETSGNHTLALKGDGTIVGWGLNEAGQATAPPGVVDVTQIAVGWSHSMALRRDGSIAVWGSNSQGQTDVPPGLGPVRWVTAGYYHSVSVLGSGAVVAWGSDSHGQSAVPQGLDGVDDADASERHVLARRRDGTVVAWGSDGSGQCSVPNGLADVTQVAAGRTHSIALRANGTLAAWGSNDFGESSVPEVGPFARISAGEAFNLGLLADGRVHAWGYNGNGQANEPEGLPRLVDLDCGDEHVVAATVDGKAIAWGYNGYGQTDVPAGLSGVVQVAAAEVHSLALRNDGTIVGWGSNTRGQCNVPGSLVAAQIAAGGYHSVARSTAGTVTCWGFGGYGQLSVPAGLSQVVQVESGYGHVLALTDAGVLRAWGWNNYGQATVPAGLPALKHVGAGVWHTIAVRDDGSVVAWGRNAYGQTEVPGGLADVIKVDGGEAHSVALRMDGSVVAWGAGVSDTDTAPNYGQCIVPSGLVGATDLSAGNWFTMVLLDPVRSDCGNLDGAGEAELAISGSAWQEVRAWSWPQGTVGPQVPGAATSVDFGTYGSVGSDCEAHAMRLTIRSAASLLVPASASAPGNDFSIRVEGSAHLSGRLWLLGVSGGAGELPVNLDLPVLSAGEIDGTFDLLQTDVPPPAGFFLTLIPSEVNGRPVLNLRLLPLPGGAELSGASAGTFNGTAVAAETIDIDSDGFDDLALAVSFGPNSPGLVQVLLNDGAGNLGSTSVLEVIPAQPTCLAVGDVNLDGRDDVVVGLASDLSARVYLSDGGGNLSPGTAITGLPSTPTSVIVIPPPGASLVAASASVGVGLSGSKLQIYEDTTLQQEVTMAGAVETVRGGNTGGAGGTDIVTGGSKSASINLMPSLETGFVQVLRRQGNGQFAIVQTMELTAKPVGMDVADLDGDGLDDIVTANAEPQLAAPGGALPVLSIFRNTSGSFGGGVPYQPAGASSGLSVSLIDVDNDGDRDIVSVHNRIGTDSEAALLRVDTLGTGTPISIGQTTVLDANDPVLSARGNLNGTGGDDLYLVDNSGGSYLTGAPQAKPYLGAALLREGDLDGNGIVDFGDVVMCLLEFGPCGGCPADLDGTGIVDYGDVVLVLLNFG
jgi:alpha-tubulin suppressor-like RCC1 family protein